MANKLLTSNTASTSFDAAATLQFLLTKNNLNFNCLAIAQVIAVETNGLLTVKSLTNYKLVDNTPIDPPEIYDVPFGMIRGGNCGIIIQYKVGDIVLVGFIDREITSLKYDKDGNPIPIKQYTPAIIRNHNIADAFVIMSWGNLANTSMPSTYISMNDSDGIKISSNNPINIISSTVNLGADTGVNGVITATGTPQVVITQGSSAGTYPVQNIAISTIVKAG